MLTWVFNEHTQSTHCYGNNMTSTIARAAAVGKFISILHTDEYRQSLSVIMFGEHLLVRNTHTHQKPTRQELENQMQLQRVEY